MIGDWPQTHLRDHVDIILGFAFKSEQFRASPPGIHLARGDNITEGRFKWDEKTRYWPDLTEDLRRYLLQRGDILIGMDGSKVGRNWTQVREEDLPSLLVQRVACLRSRRGLDQGFLATVIASQSFKDYVNAVKTGSSIPHISGGQIGDFTFFLPSISEQNAIAHILDTLNDKINLNRRMNKTLEAIAKALYKSWFLDFDPVHAKFEGRDTGLSKDIDDLFSASFEDSEMGKIPKRWRVVPIGSLAEIVGGSTPSTTDRKSVV